MPDEMKWTPGPWKQEGTLIWSPQAKATICSVSELRASNFVQFAKPDYGSDDLEEIHANARLISSAPDLYGALEALLAAAEDHPFGYIDNGNQARAKAERNLAEAEAAASAALSRARGAE